MEKTTNRTRSFFLRTSRVPSRSISIITALFLFLFFFSDRNGRDSKGLPRKNNSKMDRYGIRRIRFVNDSAKDIGKRVTGNLSSRDNDTRTDERSVHSNRRFSTRILLYYYYYCYYPERKKSLFNKSVGLWRKRRGIIYVAILIIVRTDFFMGITSRHTKISPFRLRFLVYRINF